LANIIEIFTTEFAHIGTLCANVRGNVT